MTKRNFWWYLSWIAFAIVFLYFLLKILGIIHSPISIDLIALISAAFFVGRFVKKIDDMFKNVKIIKKDLQKLNTACPVLKS